MDENSSLEKTEQARDWLKRARRVTVLTGAGISEESGVPTFRGAGGLWKHFRAEDLATPHAFARDPGLVWEWYDWRRQRLVLAEPNPGHHALAALEARTPQFALVTQNVDGLHQRAGSKSVLEIHGSIWSLHCTGCRAKWTDYAAPLPVPPLCQCGSMARPGVVWFGEGLPMHVWTAAENAATACDTFLVVGTSAVVYPAASLIPRAHFASARVIEVNLEPTPMSEIVDCSLIGKAGEILPQLL